MAYFANGTESDCFDCKNCKYKEHPCPIFAVQFFYNYDAANNEIARKILDALVSNDGTCHFFEMAKKDLFIDEGQTELF
jgi:hypothetical protein